MIFIFLSIIIIGSVAGLIHQHFQYKADMAAAKRKKAEAREREETLFCTEPEEEEALDESIDLDSFLTDKDRKKLFDAQQAEMDVAFYTEQIDSLYDDYRSMQEDLDILAAKIEIAQGLGKIETARKLGKDCDKIKSKMFTVSNRIHSFEKRLHAAQFKAGMMVTV